MATSRRDVLIGLAISTPIASALLPNMLYAQAETPILKVSRVIVGRDDLSAALADRVYAALTDQISGFEENWLPWRWPWGMAGIAMRRSRRLMTQKLDLALKIAQPWYTGVAGIGNEHGFDDGAVFITCLEAEALRSLQDSTPFRTYSTGAPGWWVDPAPDVAPPPMPSDIRDWSYVPPGASGVSATADPAFVTLVTSKEL